MNNTLFPIKPCLNLVVPSSNWNLKVGPMQQICCSLVASMNWGKMKQHLVDNFTRITQYFKKRKSCLGMFPVYYNYNKTIYFAHANLEYKKFQLKGGYFWHLLTYCSTSPTVSFLPSIWLYPQWSFGNPQIHNPGVLTQHLGTEKLFLIVPEYVLICIVTV